MSLRYLMGARRSRVPSVITAVAVLGVSAGVATLLVVLAILGGFEGDLRDKILGTKAHLRVTGPDEAPLDSPDRVLAVLDSLPGVLGASPFIESELLIASVTNYSGMILRGVVPERLQDTTILGDAIVEGSLAWLHDPDAARRARAWDRDPPTASEVRAPTAAEARLLAAWADVVPPFLRSSFLAWVPDSLQRAEEARREVEALLEDLRSERAALEEALADQGVLLDRGPAGLQPGAGAEGPGAVGRSGLVAEEPHPEAHPSAAADAESHAEEGEAEAGSFVMPSLPPPTTSPEGQSGLRFAPTPGIVIGSQLRETLRVEVGDVVQILSPDGDLGPTGPMPRVRPYRVVGVYHTGLYEFDNAYVLTLLESARAFLDLPAEQVTGVEVRLRRMEDAPSLRGTLERRLRESGVEQAAVKDWQELNSSLFAALQLEKVVMFLILSIIILVASFAIVCMLTVIVIEKRREIAVLKSMGASQGSILRLFLLEGGLVGTLGTLLGLALGMSVVAYLSTVGYPLDPEVFYIDRLPVRLHPLEAGLVTVAAVVISLLATLYPSMQAARLHPVDGLRDE